MNSYKTKQTLAILIAAGSLPLAAMAGTASLSTVVISADKIDTSAQLAHEARHESPNPKTVIEAEQLNQFGDQPLGDALRRLVGVSFDGANRAREIQLRNVGVEYTQVTINGRRILDGNSSRTVQVDRIPSSLVERIEIIHTPQANQDGQGAVGTVNIVLKQGADSNPNEVGVGVGYLDENGAVGDSTVFYSVGDERLRLTLSGGIQQQRRNESKDTYTYTGAGVANSGSLNTNVRRYEQVNLTPRIDMNIDARNSVQIEPMHLRTTEFRTDVKKTLSTNQATVTKAEDEFRKRTRENNGLYAAWKHTTAGETVLTSSLDWQEGSEDTTRDAKTLDAAGAVTGTRQRTQDVSMGLLKVGLGAQTRLGAHALEYGLGQSSESRSDDSTDVKDGVLQAVVANQRIKIEEKIFNLYAQDSYSPFAGNLLTFGLRGEKSSTSTADIFSAPVEHSSMKALPSFSMRQVLTPTTDLRLGVAQTLRRPNLRELSPGTVQNSGTFAKPDVGGNPDAVPESILGLDLGVDHFLYGRKGLLSAKVFARQFNDKLENIYATEAGRVVTRPKNVGDGHMTGLELEMRMPLEDMGMKNVTLWSNLTTVKTEVTSRQTGETRRFLDQPDHVANLGLDWYIPAINTTLGGSLNYASGYSQRYKLADGTTQLNDVGSMTRFDLSARVQLSKQTSLNISALNLLARDEKRVDETLSAAGVSTSLSATTEPTYRSIYFRLSHMF